MTKKHLINAYQGLKTYFVVKDRNDFSIVKVVVSEYKTKDCIKRGKQTFATANQLRKKYPDEKFTIDTITTSNLDLPITLDKSIIQHNIIQ